MLSSQLKKSGELEFFKKEWEKHNITKCEVCGKPIHFSHYYCAHILGKGAYEMFRLYPYNIAFLCDNCHSLWDTDREKTYRDKRWRWVHRRRERLVCLYYALKKNFFAQVNFKTKNAIS